MQHQHRFWYMGHDYQCVCGATKPDERTDQQRALDRERATLAFKARANAAWDARRPRS